LFIGHFATAYAAKRLAPHVTGHALRRRAAARPRLAWLVLAGVERATVAPATPLHSPPFRQLSDIPQPADVVAWGAAFGALHFWRRRRPLDALVLAALAVATGSSTS